MNLNTFFVIAIISIGFLIVVVAFSYVTVNATAPTAEDETITSVEYNPMVVNLDTIYNIPLSRELQLFTKRLCENHQLDYELVLAVMQVESRFDEEAYNPTSECIGLMQVNIINCTELYRVLRITDLKDPHQNIESGIYLLNKCFKQSEGNVNYALMMYNCGVNKAKQLWNEGVTETNYTRKVLEAKANLKIKEKIYYEETFKIEHYN